MSQTFLITTSAIVLILVALFVGLIIVGASIYDIGMIRRQARYQELVQKLRKPLQPFITIVIVTHNDAGNIINTLRSINASRYRNYRIVIVDDHSSDATKKVIREYIKAYPQRPVRIYTGKASTDTHTRLSHVVRLHNSAIVTVLPGSSVIERDALRQVAVRLSQDTKLGGLWLGQRITSGDTLGSILYGLQRPLTELYQKARTIVHFRSTHTFSSTLVVYQKGFFKHPSRIGDASEICVHTKQGPLPVSISSTSRAGTTLANFGAIVFVILTSYWMYTAALLQSYLLLLLGWAILCVWLAVGLVSTKSIDFKRRVTLFASIPPAFFVLYVCAIVFVISRLISFRRSQDP